jgi:uncharacterized membrane protein
MKKIFNAFFIILTIALICTLVIYLLFSFAIWDFNPEHWSNTARNICSLLSGCMGIIIGVIVYVTNQDNINL